MTSQKGWRPQCLQLMCVCVCVCACTHVCVCVSVHMCVCKHRHVPGNLSLHLSQNAAGAIQGLIC